LDSTFTYLNQPVCLLDLVDRDWASDRLPNEDPRKLGLNIESIREAEDQKNKATKWTDLALEDFTNH